MGQKKKSSPAVAMGFFVVFLTRTFNMLHASQLCLYNIGSEINATMLGLGDYNWNAQLMEALRQMQSSLPAGRKQRRS